MRSILMVLLLVASALSLSRKAQKFHGKIVLDEENPLEDWIALKGTCMPDEFPEVDYRGNHPSATRIESAWSVAAAYCAMNGPKSVNLGLNRVTVKSVIGYLFERFKEYENRGVGTNREGPYMLWIEGNERVARIWLEGFESTLNNILLKFKPVMDMMVVGTMETLHRYVLTPHGRIVKLKQRHEGLRKLGIFEQRGRRGASPEEMAETAEADRHAGISAAAYRSPDEINFWPVPLIHRGKRDNRRDGELSNLFDAMKAPFISSASGSIEYMAMLLEELYVDPSKRCGDSPCSRADLHNRIVHADLDRPEEIAVIIQHYPPLIRSRRLREVILAAWGMYMVADGHHSLIEILIAAQSMGYFKDVFEPLHCDATSGHYMVNFKGDELPCKGATIGPTYVRSLREFIRKMASLGLRYRNDDGSVCTRAEVLEELQQVVDDGEKDIISVFESLANPLAETVPDDPATCSFVLDLTITYDEDDVDVSNLSEAEFVARVMANAQAAPNQSDEFEDVSFNEDDDPFQI